MTRKDRDEGTSEDRGMDHWEGNSALAVENTYLRRGAANTRSQVIQAYLRMGG